MTKFNWANISSTKSLKKKKKKKKEEFSTYFLTPHQYVRDYVNGDVMYNNYFSIIIL